jgi:hypothetical protein
MKKRIFIIICIIAVLIAAAGIGLFAYYNVQSDLVYAEVYVEAGSSNCDVSEFLKREASGAKFTKDSVFDVNVPGDYQLKIEWKMPIFGTQTYDTVLHI